MAERDRKDYASDETFAELMESAEQALRYERGERDGYRVTRVIISRRLRLTSYEVMPPKSTPKISRGHNRRGD